jgi:5,5'-dehydrodivanillate O-demethylase oxygenase subunit
MLSKEANERLTRVGPGTPMGELLRRYWYPVATVPELESEPVLAVKLLGENLALYRNDAGELGLVSERCPHRGASLAYGIPEDDGLRCPYHGWKFSPQGRCLEQPAEPPESTFKHRVQIPAYPVQSMGGLIWAYLGPEPAPLLPRFDLFVRDDVEREIGITRLPCNWLQIMENSLDPVHLEYLHSVYMNYVFKRQGKATPTQTKHHDKIAFDVFEYGITKRRLWEGESEDSTEWTVGHPILFPNILSVGDPEIPQFQIRVPMDDTHTYHVWYRCKKKAPDAPVQSEQAIPVLDYAYKEDNGRLIVETVSGQDMMVWVTQGGISDRTTERLGSTDQGVILFRNLLDENIRKVERGEEPMAIIRDPAKNTPMVQVHRETTSFRVSGGNNDLFAARREHGSVQA